MSPLLQVTTLAKLCNYIDYPLHDKILISQRVLLEVVLTLKNNILNILNN